MKSVVQSEGERWLLCWEVGYGEGVVLMYHGKIYVDMKEGVFCFRTRGKVAVESGRGVAVGNVVGVVF